jgi:hypothetical protein
MVKGPVLWIPSAVTPAFASSAGRALGGGSLAPLSRHASAPLGGAQGDLGRQLVGRLLPLELVPHPSVEVDV